MTILNRTATEFISPNIEARSAKCPLVQPHPFPAIPPTRWCCGCEERGGRVGGWEDGRVGGWEGDHGMGGVITGWQTGGAEAGCCE